MARDRITVNISPRTDKIVKEAEDTEGSITRAVERAFAIYKAVRDAEKAGRRIVLEDRDGGNREVIKLL